MPHSVNARLTAVLREHEDAVSYLSHAEWQRVLVDVWLLMEHHQYRQSDLCSWHLAMVSFNKF